MLRPLPPSRTRRIAKWTGLVVCALLSAMWAASTVCAVAWFSPHGQYGWFSGLVRVNWDERLAYHGMDPPVWIVERTEFGDALALPSVQSLARDYVSFIVPFWLLLTLAAIPTALLWQRDRRTVKPGCCLTCGYDLRASKKTCPECGTPVEAKG